MSLTVTFKKNNSPVEKLDKEFSDSQSFSVVLKESTEVFKPTFILQTSESLDRFNYIDGSDFSGRQYFITDVRSIGNNRYEVDAKTDVLSTWKSNIRSNSAIINKQQDVVKGNKYLNDGSFVSQVNEFNTSYNFSGGFNDSGVFILICAGG